MNNKNNEQHPQILIALDSCVNINKLDRKQISDLILQIENIYSNDQIVFDPVTNVKLHLGLGDAHAKLGNFDLAESEYQTALKLCADFQDQSYKVKAVNGGCIIRAIHSDYLKAIEGWQALLPEITDIKTQADIYNNLGISYSMTDRHREALDCQYHCLKIDEELGRETEIATDFFNLASSYMKLRQFNKSLELYNKAAQSFEASKNYRYLSFAYSNLCMVYDDMNQYDQALEYAFKSLELKQSFANDLELGNTYANIGNILHSQKKYDLALEYFQQGQVLFERGDDKIALAGLFVKFAWLYFETGKPQEAEDYASRAYQIGVEINSPHVIQGSSKFLSQLYADQNKFEQAYNFLNIYTKTHAKIFADNPKIMIAKSEADYYRKKTEEQADVYLQRNIELTDLNNVISEQSKLLFVANTDLEETNQLMHKMFSVISHDIKGPVLSSIQLLEMIQMKEFSEDETDELLKELTLSLTNTGNLLNDLLSWSNKQQHSDSSLKKLDIVPIISDCISLYKSSALLKSLDISYVGNPEVFAMAEKNSLHTIIRNLLHNAVKFTPEQGAITVSVRSELDRIMIDITDTGIGISPEGMARLLAGNPELKQGTFAESGTGIGIGLCLTYIKQLNGKLMITSELTKGTTFTVILNAD